MALKPTITAVKAQRIFSELHSLLSDHDYMLEKRVFTCSNLIHSILLLQTSAVGHQVIQPELRQAQLIRVGLPNHPSPTSPRSPISSPSISQLSPTSPTSPEPSTGQPSPVSAMSIPTPPPPKLPPNERTLVEFAKPYLMDMERILQIIDPQMDGQYSSILATRAANLAMTCLLEEPNRRPGANEVVEALEQPQELQN
ncbi:Protein kinase, ATP binding site-containing protein [Artemisia annua]|uniref:Protein kinase, ATP binding site-containing protein n=1 Tax=Artemisia annua TaxID=35608 RepID=A0A2U1QJ17_ARTAN|nr:Protein kinase, ATP binding site-containing protein [Artemisia annua]